jgi:hypothetical protein
VYGRKEYAIFRMKKPDKITLDDYITMSVFLVITGIAIWLIWCFLEKACCG